MEKYRTEYAGFRYIITVQGGMQDIHPEPGQDLAAHRWKHRQAAMQEWLARRERESADPDKREHQYGAE